MRTTVDHFTTAEEVALDQARGLARTIADTLAAMYPSAAYLVMHHDEDDVLWLHSIRDAAGAILCDFEGAPGSATLADTELRQAWGELDPNRPMHLLHLARRMEGVGGCFDILPESAYNEDDSGDDGLLCLLLCDQAEPEMWDWGGDAILRPYSAPGPGDQIPVLGGAAFLSVLDISHDPDTGATSLHIDAAPSGPGPFLLSTGSMVNVHRPEPEQAEHPGEDDEEGTVTVSLAVTEQVTYEFETEVQIPAGLVGDADALHEYLADNEELWLDSLDPSGANGYLSVNERTLDTVEVVLAA